MLCFSRNHYVSHTSIGCAFPFQEAQLKHSCASHGSTNCASDGTIGCASRGSKYVLLAETQVVLLTEANLCFHEKHNGGYLLLLWHACGRMSIKLFFQTVDWHVPRQPLPNRLCARHLSADSWQAGACEAVDGAWACWPWACQRHGETPCQER